MGSAMNGLVLLVVVMVPHWLGMAGWWPTAVADDSHVVKAVARSNGLPTRAEWVDVGKDSWQLDDVRVSVSSVVVGQVELIGPNKQRKLTKEQYLQLHVRIANEGITRRIEFQGWTATGPLVTEAKGKQLAAKTFETGWEPANKPRLVALYPGKSMESVLFFEVPAVNAEYLRLELPAAPFGSTETVKFQIPRSLMVIRPTSTRGL